jgi:hypothetical protein
MFKLSIGSRLRGNDGLEFVSYKTVIPAKAGIYAEHALATDLIVQITPQGIRLVYQIDLPRAVPLLQLFFAGDRAVHPVVNFEPNQPFDAMSLDETVNQRFAMLPDALDQIRRDTNIQGAISRTSEHVHISH